MTPPEMARQWGIGVDKVLAWIRSGELRAINVASQREGRPRYLIDLADIAVFEAARSVAASTPVARRRRRRCDATITEFF